MLENIERELKMMMIKEEVNGFLNGTLKEKEWNDLLDENYVDQAIRGNMSSRDVAEKVLHRRQVYGRSKKPKVDQLRMLSEQEEENPKERSTVISLLIAQEAADDTEVQRFRHEVLADNLLTEEAVEQWIKQQRQLDGPPTVYLNDLPISQTDAEKVIKLRMGSRPDTPLLTLEIPIDQLKRHISLRGHSLHYLGPDGWSRSEPTTIGGVLERLRELSSRLAEQYKWTEAQATQFVLTGVTPLISTLHFTLKGGSRPLFERILLEVDPVLLPQEVAELYQVLRKEMMTGRQRKLSKKHMQLALFVARRPKNKTWAVKMAEWNRTHPIEWQYEEIANFSHDCLQAQRRLLRSETEE